MIPCHYQFMAQQLVDSSLGTTRAFWRTKVGCPQFADDPRPLADCLAEQLVTKDRPEAP